MIAIQIEHVWDFQNDDAAVAAVRLNGWYTLRAKFIFKGTSLVNHLCTVRQPDRPVNTLCDCLTTLPLTVFARRNSIADFFK